MADKTFGVKVSEELHDRVKNMIEFSGMSAKEWFEKAVALTELQSIKQGSTDYNQDLNELEVHTTRIFELVTNMIQRSIYLKESAVKDVSEKLEQREAIIGEYQEKTKAAIEELKISHSTMKVIEQEKDELSKQLEQVLSTNENNQLLINEYKEKNDTLSGLVNKYQSFAEENERLKQHYAEEKERLNSAIQELKTTNLEQEDKVKQLIQQVDTLKRDHEIEIERVTERKEYEKERALIEVERNYQEKLLSSNEEYNERVKELYAEISTLRKEYEEKISTLQDQLNKRNNLSGQQNNKSK